MVLYILFVFVFVFDVAIIGLFYGDFSGIRIFNSMGFSASYLIWLAHIHFGFRHIFPTDPIEKEVQQITDCEVIPSFAASRLASLFVERLSNVERAPDAPLGQEGNGLPV